MTDENETRRAILARRARFVAAAVAGIGIACGKEPRPTPQPCLEIAEPTDAAPVVCLSVPQPLPLEHASVDGGDSDAAAPTPRPCLSIRPRPNADAGKPRACLSSTEDPWK